MVLEGTGVPCEGLPESLGSPLAPCSAPCACAQPYKPLLKFACFKAVIFLTFWQVSGVGARLCIE